MPPLTLAPLDFHYKMKPKERNQAGAGAAARHASSSWGQPMDCYLTLSEVWAMHSARWMERRGGSVSDGAEDEQAADASRLLLTGCGQECIPEPVGPGLTGSTNGACDFLRLCRSQSHLKHYS